MDNRNLPAYPQPLVVGTGGDIIASSWQHSDYAGMSKREMIAAMCLQGLLANKGIMYRNPNYTLLSTEATNYANALLSHLSNTDK